MSFTNIIEIWVTSTTVSDDLTKGRVDWDWTEDVHYYKDWMLIRVLIDEESNDMPEETELNVDENILRQINLMQRKQGLSLKKAKRHTKANKILQGFLVSSRKEIGQL